MASVEETGQSTGDTNTIEVAKTIAPEVKVAAVQALLSEGPIEVSETLRDRRGETLALVKTLFAAAGIEGIFYTPKTDKPNRVTVELSQTGAPDDKELAREQQAWLDAFKGRFKALPELHHGVKWADVEKSLKADPEAMRKLQVLDEAGFEMNVFDRKSDEIVFRTAQVNIKKIVPEFRNIMYDEKAQTDYPQYSANGNAVDFAASIGVELADEELYEEFRLAHGWVWLKTDDNVREAGFAFRGTDEGVWFSSYANSHDAYGSFCPALRVKKA